MTSPAPPVRRRAPGARRAAAWGAVVAWALGIAWASSQPAGGGVPLPGPGLDKAAHLAVFAVLGALAAVALRFEGCSPWRSAAAGAALATAYGGLDELHQRWTPGRVASLADLAADATGAVFGAAAVGRLARRGAGGRAA